MDRSTADRALQDQDLVPFDGAASAAKELERRLLAADIPVALSAKPKGACCSGGGCGCSGKMQLLVLEKDVERVQQLLARDWLDAVEREGLVSLKVGPAPEGAGEGLLACPACGCAAPLKDGACSDCGLFLGEE